MLLSFFFFFLPVIHFRPRYLPPCLTVPLLPSTPAVPSLPPPSPRLPALRRRRPPLPKAPPLSRLCRRFRLRAGLFLRRTTGYVGPLGGRWGARSEIYRLNFPSVWSVCPSVRISVRRSLLRAFFHYRWLICLYNRELPSLFPPSLPHTIKSSLRVRSTCCIVSHRHALPDHHQWPTMCT